MKAAFIMRARTPNNDYVTDKFLAAPDDFGEEENMKVHSYVSGKIQSLQTDPSGFIGVTYCDKEFVIAGICTYISVLYDKCGLKPRYSMDGTDGSRKYRVFLGFVFRRNDVHDAFDVTFKRLAEYYERYISEFWDKPLIFGGMKPVSSQYDELTFSKADSVSKVAVSLSPDMLKNTVASSSPVDSAEQKEEHTIRESKHGFSVLFCTLVVIVISVVATILGSKLMTKQTQDNHAQQTAIMKGEAVTPLP